MRIKKTLILCTAVNAFVLLSLILVSRSSASETALASLNLRSASFANSLRAARSTLSDSNLSDAVISAVQSGSTSTSNITVGPNPNPINTTVEIDIRIDNTSSIWGWTLPTVTWNATVLQLTAVKEGPFLADNTGGDPTSFIGNSKALWDNTNGAVLGGLSEAITAADTSTDPSGVLATLTFNVTSYGNSTITIAGANLRATNTDTTGVNVTCNSATITVANTTTIPEFPSWIILPLFIIATLAALVCLRKMNRLNSLWQEPKDKREQSGKQ